MLVLPVSERHIGETDGQAVPDIELCFVAQSHLGKVTKAFQYVV